MIEAAHSSATSIRDADAPARPVSWPTSRTSKLRPPAVSLRPEPTLNPSDIRDLAYSLIRVLDDDGAAVGPWVPNRCCAGLHEGLRAMMMTRAFDERMIDRAAPGQDLVLHALHRRRGDRRRRKRWRCDADDMCLPDLPPAGIADRPPLAAGRDDVPGLSNAKRPAERPAVAGHVLVQATPASSRSRATSARSSSRPWAGRWHRRSRATPASRRAGSARARRPRPTSTTR